VAIDTNKIHYKELFITGAHGSMPVHHRRAIEMIANGVIDVKKFITHKFGLDGVLKAFEAAEKHEGLRVVVNP
jgi:L-iditol 2-dehydrogenase